MTINKLSDNYGISDTYSGYTVDGTLELTTDGYKLFHVQFFSGETVVAQADYDERSNKQFFIYGNESIKMAKYIGDNIDDILSTGE
jgi:hypothetical protein